VTAASLPHPVTSQAAITGTTAITATTGVTTTGAITAENTAAEIHTVTVYGGDESSLREFLRQYLIAPFGLNDDSATTVYVGTLPPDLPLTLDIPADMTTVGTIVTTGEYSNSQLLFSLEQDVTDSLAALRQQLQSQGYFQPSPSGEVFQTQPDDYVSWCNPEGTLAVVVTGRNLADRTGIIRLFITHVLPTNGPCASAPAGGSGRSGDLESVLPTLAAPPNVAAFQSGMSSGGDSVEAMVGFTGDITIAALAEHYHAQLEAAGWQQLGASQTEDIAWSGWSITEDDRSYMGTFTLVRDAGSSDRFRASLRIEQAR
jgi:hypothetical protein